MTHTDSNRHIVDVLFVLALFGVFAACALMLVTIGAGVYKKTVANMNDNYAERTAYSYLMEKLRQNDSTDVISLNEIAGTPVLTFTTNAGEETVCTCLYLYDGYLKELFVRKSALTDAQILAAGQNIMPLSSLEMEKTENGLIRLTLDTGSGKPIILYAAPRSGRKASL